MCETELSEAKALLESMPLSTTELHGLFDHLNEVLSGPNEPDLRRCDHTLKKAKQYCHRHNLPPAKVLPWLESCGGYCDCEVMLNVVGRWNSVVQVLRGQRPSAA